ncbi:DUF2147 domain-containing protein [Pseudoduganella chitinolytica]|uniref:DUF2147 domain-containing protein n=1 Tax=Pseudoduganella chitinolytica TaxID=34070 RepID=A0ABY8B9W3_9BURK|nr:DUF2147 domain-containing protein [Pseudoduganella chitinolytica]WEF32716.1 DUF2147 domain-containing protein [Pseudoduganella chitinolytica]
MPRSIHSTLLAAALALAALPLRAAPPPESGRWITASGNLEVEIAPCGDALCGTVSKVLGNRSMSHPGQPMPAADSRPVPGMQLLTGLRSVGDGTWQGRLYNRENGQTYDCRLRLAAPDRLEVQPTGLPAMAPPQVWRRAAGAMP